MRISVFYRPVAVLALTALVATASHATANPARTLDQSPSKPTAPLSAPSRAALDESFGRLPLQFEVNRGQVDPRVRYLTRGSGSTLFLTDDEAVLVLSRHEKAPESETMSPLDRRDRGRREKGKRVSSVVRMKLEGSKPKPRLDGLDRLPGNVNYFIGNDPKKWRTDVPTYRKVKIEDVYEGIDLVYYGNQHQVEYDFVVKPGVDPSVIRIAFTGADRISTDAAGDLLIATAVGNLRMKSPLVYQERDGRRELVAAAYVVLPGERKVEFRLASYDRTRELVIDPVVVWSTYAGPLEGQLLTVSALAAGDVVTTGWANHASFPTTPGAFQPTDPSGSNYSTGVVMRLNANGTALVYSTYLGGPLASWIKAAATDSTGSVFVTGWTMPGASFPTTPGALVVDGSSVFVTRLSPSGNSLLYSARIGGGGPDQGLGIAVDSAGHAYVCGRIVSGPLDVSPGAVQGLSSVPPAGAGFAAKLSATGASLIWATVLGGVVPTRPVDILLYSIATDIAVDSAGNAFVVGTSNAADFPTTQGSFQPSHTPGSGGTGHDAFVLKIPSTGTGLTYSTFLGITRDTIRLEVDGAGYAYVAGETHDFSSFPTTPGAIADCCSRVFVSKLAPDGSSLVYSTRAAEYGLEVMGDIAVDSAGQAIITGLDRGSAGDDYYLLRLNSTGSALSYAFRFGPADASSDVNEGPSSLSLGTGTEILVAGMTRSVNLPTTPGSFQPSDPDPRLGAPYPADGFVIRLRIPQPVSATSINPATGPSLGGTPITITGTGFQAGAVVRLGGIPATVSDVTPTSISAVTGPHPAGLVDVEVENPDGGVGLIKNGFTYVCGGTAPTATLTGGGAVCAGQSSTLSVALTGTAPWSLVWSDGVTQGGLASSPATRVVTPLSTTTYRVLTVVDTTCAGTATGSAVVTVNPVPSTAISAPSRVCATAPATASVPAAAGAIYGWTVTNGTIVSGQGTNSLSFTGTADPVTVSVVASIGSCSSSSSRAIAVSVPPTATVSGAASICEGASAPVSYSLTGTPPFTITWSDGFVQFAGTAGPGTRTVSPSGTTTYQITSLADGTGCPGGSSTGTAMITVNPVPSAAISSPAGFCAGASGIAASVPDAGPGATYAWTIAGGTFDGGSTARTVSFTPASASVTLGVTVTLPTGCSASSVRVVALTPAPTAAVSGGGTICARDEARIAVNLTGTPPFSLTWSDGLVQSGLPGPVVQRTVRPATSTTYTLTSVSDSACAGSTTGSASFQVVEPPSATMQSPDVVICPGGSTLVTVALAGQGPYTLTWSDGLAETVAGPEHVRVVSPPATTSYFVGTVRNATCSRSGVGATLVTVFPDAASRTITSPAEACAESTGNAASVPDSGAGITYLWSIANGTLTSGQGTRAVTFAAGAAGETTVGVTVRSAAGCETSGSRRVRVNPRPATPVISAPPSLESGDADVVAQVPDVPGDAFTWSIENGVITSGAGTHRITFTTGYPGLLVLTVVERSAAGCDSPAGRLEIPVRGLRTSRLVPIVLDVAGSGGARYTTELALSNPSPSPIGLTVEYRAADALGGGGSGSVTDTLRPGEQRIVPDVLAWLRGQGLAIPTDGSSQGGTLRVTFEGLPAGALPSATARTTVPSGAGRAGVSMPGVETGAGSTAKAWLFGLRETAADRSHVALVNAGSDGEVELRVTLHSGDGASVPRHVLPAVRLGPGQWVQLGSVLRTAGFASGYALVERVTGGAPFHAYAVFNDNATHDGSVVPAVPGGSLRGTRIVPVVVETGAFSSELILSNPGHEAVRASVWFTESLANPGGSSQGGVTIDLGPGQQQILPDVLAEFRKRGMDILPRQRAYAGTLAVSFASGGEMADGWAGARTSTAGPGPGRYGLFCSAPVPDASTSVAWLFGLLQNAGTRTNLALLNAAANRGPVTLRYTVFDGADGRTAGVSNDVTLGPGAWLQVDRLLSKYGLENGYVRVERVGGTAPFVAYAVLNDGGIPGAGTGDGSFVEMVPAPR